MLLFKSVMLTLLLCLSIKSIKSKIKPLIIGGSKASIEDFPHTVYLETSGVKNNNERDILACTASILNHYILMTAAHCFEGFNKIYYSKAGVGSNLRSKLTYYNVYSFIKHENQRGDTEGDIALLKLERPLKFGKTVKRVAIMKSPPYNEPASFAGWGLTEYGGKVVADSLNYLSDMKIWSREHCLKHSFGTFGSPKSVPTDSFCAGYNQDDDPRTTYLGDSGGALVVRGYIQIGILVTLATGISNYKPVNIYVDVEKYYDWIKKNAKEMYCNKSKGAVRIKS